MCYRHFDHHNTDTNMLVERYSYTVLHSHDACYNYMHAIYDYSFHNKLKTNPRHLAHQVNRRIDDLIGTLLLIKEDLFFNRMRKEVMKDSGEASLKLEGNERHTRGIEIPDNSVEVYMISY